MTTKEYLAQEELEAKKLEIRMLCADARSLPVIRSKLNDKRKFVAVLRKMVASVQYATANYYTN